MDLVESSVLGTPIELGESLPFEEELSFERQEFVLDRVKENFPSVLLEEHAETQGENKVDEEIER
jgi:hypothetical protein